MLEKVIMAGFGGQGIMSIGQMLTYAGMNEGKEVSWMPSYGPEMRGGTANCHVIVSDHEVASPVINDATTALILNKPSLTKFETSVRSGGSMLINSSLVDIDSSREDVYTYMIPANDIAVELGNVKTANMVMLGAFIELTKAVEVDTIFAALKKVLGEKKAHLFDVNIEAFKRGANMIHTNVLAS